MVNPFIFYLIFYPVFLNIMCMSDVQDPMELVIDLNDLTTNL